MNQRFDIENGKKVIKEDSPVTDAASNMYPGGKVPVFNQDIYFDVGASLLIALLDYNGINPISRLVKKKGESLEEAVAKVRESMRKGDEKQSMADFKK